MDSKVQQFFNAFVQIFGTNAVQEPFFFAQHFGKQVQAIVLKNTVSDELFPILSQLQVGSDIITHPQMGIFHVKLKDDLFLVVTCATGGRYPLAEGSYSIETSLAKHPEKGPRFVEDEELGYVKLCVSYVSAMSPNLLNKRACAKKLSRKRSRVKKVFLMRGARFWRLCIRKRFAPW